MTTPVLPTPPSRPKKGTALPILPTDLQFVEPDATADPRTAIQRAMLTTRPFVDSLRAVAGSPEQLVERSGVTLRDGLSLGPQSNTEGLYTPFSDKIEIARGPGADEGAVVHEFGHRLEARGDPRARAAFDSALARYPRGRPSPTVYAATNRSEQFAEAFRNAVQLLRDSAPATNELRDIDYVRRIGAMDAEVPGTAALTRYLVTKTPTWRGHRLATTFAGLPDAVPTTQRPLPSVQGDALARSPIQAAMHVSPGASPVALTPSRKTATP